MELKTKVLCYPDNSRSFKLLRANALSQGDLIKVNIEKSKNQINVLGKPFYVKENAYIKEYKLAWSARF